MVSTVGALLFLAVSAAATFGEQSGAVSRDCSDLRVIERLARIAGPPSVSEMVSVQAVLTCQTGAAARKWSNGDTAKGIGVWYHPVGDRKQAALRSGVLYYPNGVPAIRSGVVRYPDNTVAFRSGKWHRPGVSTGETLDALRSWACPKLGAVECEKVLTTSTNAPNNEKDLAIVEMAWRAAKS